MLEKPLELARPKGFGNGNAAGGREVAGRAQRGCNVRRSRWNGVDAGGNQAGSAGAAQAGERLYRWPAPCHVGAGHSVPAASKTAQRSGRGAGFSHGGSGRLAPPGRCAPPVVTPESGRATDVGGPTFQPFGVNPMTSWTYASGRLEARNQDGALLLVIPAEPIWASLADLFNVNQSLSRRLLAGYGYGDKPA